MTYILAFVFVLGVLVFVHELGHFLAARRIGVRVLTFSLGFGPKLVAFTRGDTEYCISAIPLGGYVKMAGETPEDTRTGAPDEFLSKTKWERFQVLVMGPVMNLALAWLVMAAVLYQGARVPIFDQDPVVIGSVEANSVATEVGLLPGDRVLSVNGRPVPNWEEFSVAVLPKANQPLTLEVERNGERTQHRITPRAQGKYDLGEIGIGPVLHPEVIQTNQGEAAEKAGLKALDVIMGVDGEANVSFERLLALIKAHEGQPLALNVLRDSQTLDIVVTPQKVSGTVRIGVTLNPWQFRTVEPGPVEALKLSAQQNWTWTKMIGKTLGGLFTRETSVNSFMGPLAIAELSGDAATQGWVQLFGLLAMISLNLGLLNLMPVPVLDGGHIAILALEGLSRRDFSMRVKEKMLLVGFVLLLSLMVTVIYNDLMRVEWIKRLVPWR